MVNIKRYKFLRYLDSSQRLFW